MENFKYYVFIAVVVLYIVFSSSLIFVLFNKFLAKKLPFKAKELKQQFGEPSKVMNVQVNLLGLPLGRGLGSGKICIYFDFIVLFYLGRALVVRDYNCIKLSSGLVYKTMTLISETENIEVYLSKKDFELIGLLKKGFNDV